MLHVFLHVNKLNIYVILVDPLASCSDQNTDLDLPYVIDPIAGCSDHNTDQDLPYVLDLIAGYSVGPSIRRVGRTFLALLSLANRPSRSDMCRTLFVMLFD